MIGARMARGLLLMVLLPAACLAVEGGAGSRRHTVSESYFKQLEQAHRLLSEGSYEHASSAVDRLAEGRLNPHEEALVWQTRGFIFALRNDYEQAAAAFEKCLALDALPDATALNTRYNLAQMYLMLERAQPAIAALAAWFEQAEHPTPDAYYLLAMAYVQADDYRSAVEPAEQAVARTEKPRESWLELLLSLYLQTNEYEKAAGVLERLVVLFPKKDYWLQLAAIYGELQQEEKSLAVLDVAYQTGFLTEGRELRNLAQMYLYQEIPYRAAELLESALAEGRIEPDAESWQLLADSWLYAKEYDRAVEPLQRAAELTNRGDLYLRLAQLHLQLERWEDAHKAASAAVAKGKLAEVGAAHLVAGIAQYKRGAPDLARQAFAAAQSHERTRSAAVRWLEHLRATSGGDRVAGPIKKSDRAS